MQRSRKPLALGLLGLGLLLAYTVAVSVFILGWRWLVHHQPLLLSLWLPLGLPGSLLLGELLAAPLQLLGALLWVNAPAAPLVPLRE